MPRQPTYRKEKEKRANNVVRDTSAAVNLTCGHTTKKNPLATRANGAALYVCPEGCGLRERRRH